MAISRIAIAKPDIVRLFDSEGRKVYRKAELAELFKKNREFWRLTQSMTLAEFVQYLVSNTQLQKVTLKLPHRPEIRYVWGKVSRYHLAVSMKPNGYLSHYAAVALHGLTDQVPKTIYVNHEQRPQPRPPLGLSQERIDTAFRRKQRVTSNIAEYRGFRYAYINGKHTGQLGVVETADELGDTVPVTGLERTLIDIAVRPNYAGGIPEVIEAYRRAHGQISLNRLAATLKKMDYVYPYEQAIGFLLERSGYDAASLHRHKTFRISQTDGFDFYLTYGMKDKVYVPEWRLYVPKGL